MISLAVLGEILRRFRFHGVPGSPVAFGVPTDRVAELNSEVEVVFAALQDNQRRAVALLAQADVEVARIRSTGAEQARRAIDASRERATTERESVASRNRDETSPSPAWAFSSRCG